MKILHLIDSLDFGGAQTVIKSIFEKNAKSDIFLLVLRKTERTIIICHPNIFIHNSYSKYLPLPLIQIRQIIKREKIDILHCHLFRSQVFGWLIKVFFFPKIKLLFHEHGQIFGTETNNLFEYKLFLLFLRFAKNKVDSFIAISKTTKNKLMSKTGINYKKINMLYNPIEPSLYQKIYLTKNSNIFSIGFAGRLVERKGIAVYLDAAKIILNKYDNVFFLVSGDGPGKSRVIDIIKQINSPSKLSYLGYTQEMSQFYSKLNCLVVPSLWEPMGMVIIEAQMAGVPVIASDIDTFKELITDRYNGILFESESLQDLVDKIELLMKDRDLQKSIIYNAYEGSKKFSISSYLQKLEQVYSTIKGN
jgi:glycosyltransferase involved in cell wall biosynthesis